MEADREEAIAMYLKTTRLLIRDWDVAQDATAAIAIYGDSAVTQWIGDQSLDTTVEAIQARLQRYRDRAAVFPGLGCWAVVTQHDQVPIGTLLLLPLPDKSNIPSGHIEIGWHFCSASWGKGYATEAARAVMAYGFDTIRLSAIYAVTLLDNNRSVRVTQRLGMTDLGISEDYYGGHQLRLFRRTVTDPEPAS
ncbi:MAG: GNAT family N-acetyltransferase [Leptolyngbya sp. SIO1D8]|nr:GNAT family N-acetyltransferase [Leptolyngbya sp. SIO1D8]